jgi:hypothetical protein
MSVRGLQIGHSTQRPVFPIVCTCRADAPYSLKAGNRHEGEEANTFVDRTYSELMDGVLAVRRSPFRRPAKRQSLREAQRPRQPNRLVSFVETTAPLRTMDYRFCRVATSSPA